ncbi:MAG: M4 family metallopeptidase [Acidobacteriota bacterium]
MNSRPTVLSRFLRTFGVVITLATLISLAGKSAETVAAQATRTEDPQISAVERADCLAFGDARTARHARTGALRFIGTEPGRPIPNPRPVEAARSPEAAARAYLSVCGALFGLPPSPNQAGAVDPISQLRVIGTPQADGGRRAIRFQQLYENVPVLGGELIVQLDAANDILAVAGKTGPKSGVDTMPAVDAAAARRAALTLVAKSYGLDPATLVTTTPERWIYDPGLLGPEAGPAVLVWRMDVTPRTGPPIRELVLIDARRGAVALHFNQVESALNRQTYTANNTKTLPGTLVCGEANPTCSGGDSQAVAAHLYAGDTYNFYLDILGRNSIDNAGLPLISTVHYDVNYNNAAWNGVQMIYGDVYGFSLADDVVAHELTHGVTQYTANLFYYYQSGAINESLSDVFGEIVDQSNGRGNDGPGVKWLVGEDITGLGAIRNMQDPPAFGDPDKMTSPAYVRSAVDNGGVHTNSGINNKAAYLMSDGGTFNGQTVAGLGIDKVARIYYEVQAHLLTSGADYADLADALYQGCNNLIGTPAGISQADCQEVQKATTAVEMTAQPAGGPFNPEAPVCATGQTPSNLFFDNLESGTGGFLFSAAIGTVRWQLDSPLGLYAHSGVHSLYADDYPDQPTDTSARMAGGVLVPAAAFLRFAHAYGFEDGSYDGGVVEYSTDAGLSWVDAGSLFDANGYTGTLVSGLGNPLGGRQAFVNDSHGYVSSRVNLATLAGQTVRFRWRMALDNGGYDWGWWLDDVSIYSCLADGSVTGHVRQANNAPIAGAVVSSGVNGVSTTTDAGGLYSLTLPAGTHTLTASAPGYASVAAAGIVVVSGGTTTKDFVLAPITVVRNGFDLNSDGFGDVFLYNRVTGARVFELAKAGGGFDPIQGAWDAGWQVYPARLNADGYTDLFLYDPARGYWIQALNQGGDGTFAYTLGNWDSSWTVVPADLDGDGLTDMFVYNFANGVWVKCFADGSGGFKDYASGNWDPGWTFNTADLNGDARDDFFLYNRTNGVWVEAFSQPGVGTFDYPASGQWDPGWQVVPADVNGDGRIDLFLLNAQGVHVTALSRASGGFDYVNGPQWTAGLTAAAGDLNFDGLADLFLYNPTTGVWSEALSDGAGGFSLASGSWDPGWAVVLTDFNADGRADVLLSRADGLWFQAINTGTATFTYVPGNWGTGWTVFAKNPSSR